MPHPLFRRSESWVEKEIGKHARATGWRPRKSNSSGRVGESDHSYAKAGKLRVLEIKRRGKEATEIQQKRMAEWREDGFEAECVDNVEDGCAFLDRE